MSTRQSSPGDTSRGRDAGEDLCRFAAGNGAGVGWAARPVGPGGAVPGPDPSPAASFCPVGASHRPAICGHSVSGCWPKHFAQTWAMGQSCRAEGSGVGLRSPSASAPPAGVGAAAVVPPIGIGRCLVPPTPTAPPAGAGVAAAVLPGPGASAGLEDCSAAPPARTAITQVKERDATSRRAGAGCDKAPGRVPSGMPQPCTLRAGTARLNAQPGMGQPGARWPIAQSDRHGPA